MKKEKPSIVEEPVKPEETVVDESQPVLKTRRLPTINRYWLLVGLAVGLIVLSIIIGSIWMANPTNPVLGLLAIALFIGGAWIIRRQIKNRHEIMGGVEVNITSTTVAQTGDKVVVLGNGHAPNSVNIYAYKDTASDLIIPNRIDFENVHKPMGQPQKCLNTGKYYYVHIWDIAKGRLVPFMLPDSKFTDPAILARYLGLPAQKKYLRNRELLMHYIGPGILAIMCIAGFIAIIALSG